MIMLKRSGLMGSINLLILTGSELELFSNVFWIPMISSLNLLENR